MLPQLKLRSGADKALRHGAVWIYDNQIEAATGGITPGDLCDVFSAGGRFLGRGFYNPRSVIAVRILTRDREEVIDPSFFRRRLETAITLRKDLGMLDSCRLVFAESDGLPALIVDKFRDVLVMQILALGMERYKETLVRLLVELLHPQGIYERDDVPVREREGLPLSTGLLYGTVPELIEIQENEAKMLVDVRNGQKTGYFLDQRENRAAIRPYVGGREVLDCFCHTGGFSVHAGIYGAAHVTAVDISETALEMAAKNAAHNGLNNIDFVCANVFDLLREYDHAGRSFDTVILDPPAFVKNRRALEKATAGYKEINLRGMKLVRPGGILITFSCSQLMTPERFLQMLREAAGDLGRPVRLLEMRMQSRDHPAAIAQEQPLYLKCFILQVL